LPAEPVAGRSGCFVALRKAFRVEFRASMPVTGDPREHLERANDILNDAFGRLIPDPGRLS
jgi:hypothetical protein